LFETEAGWNQFGGPEIMTAKHHLPRGCNVVFNNTRVRWVKLDKAGKLKWAAQDSGSQPDIHHVIWRGDFNKALSILTERPELMHEKNIFRWTPLHTAALVGQKEIVQLLLSQGARENSDYRGETPMHAAATKGHKDIVELLLAAGINPNARNIAAITPLHKAVIRGHKEVVEVLIANGANVNAKDDMGKTPLWYADERENSEIVGSLRRHGGVK
jgi:cytohesin